jgi:hypothetical protein
MKWQFDFNLWYRNEVAALGKWDDKKAAREFIWETTENQTRPLSRIDFNLWYRDEGLAALGRLTNPPPWDDKKAVHDFIRETIEKQTRLLTPDPHIIKLCWISGVESAAEVERDAVDMAINHGDFAPLADLVLGEHPRIRDIELAPSTKKLVRDRMTGRYKRPNHRPPLPEEVKHKRNPIHGAADEVKHIEAILTAAYPEERSYRTRSIEIVAQSRSVLDEVQRHDFEQKLHNYLKRGPEQRKHRKRRSPGKLRLSRG